MKSRRKQGMGEDIRVGTRMHPQRDFDRVCGAIATARPSSGQ